MGFWTWVVIIVAGGGVIAAVQIGVVNARTRGMVSRLSSLPDFSPTQQVMGCDGKSGLAVDELRKKLCLITNSAGAVSERIILDKDILSVELSEDGTSVTKTVRSSQIVGAVVGGAALGGSVQSLAACPARARPPERFSVSIYAS